MQTAAPLAREKLFNMRMSEEEWARLERVCAHLGVNAAGVIRMLVKREDDKLSSGRATWRRIVELVFAEHEAGRETTVDVISIRLHMMPQKARNAALLLGSQRILKNTTKGPAVEPLHKFQPRHPTIEKALAALVAANLDPDDAP